MNKKTERNKVQKDLLKQLTNMGADTDLFKDMINKYMNLWDGVDEMEADIKKNGYKYMAISSTGKEYEKMNEYVKLLPIYIKQMQSLLHEMGITTDAVTTDKDEDTL